MSGFELLRKAEIAYSLEHNPDKAFDLYQKCIKRIMRHENVCASAFPGGRRPAGLPADAPSETIAMAFRNFSGFFRDPRMNYTEATAPEAYKFLASFRPSHARDKDFSRFVSDRAKFVLKCLQISACMTLGLLAWDAKDRPTAAKRYKEALDLAETEPAFTSPSPPPGIETWIRQDLKQTRDNLAVLIANDEVNARMAEELTGVKGVGGTRKEVVDVPNVRVEAREGNAPSQEVKFTTATDACGNCGTRGVKLLRCSRCKKMPYCGAQCQKTHWKSHKPQCVAA